MHTLSFAFHSRNSDTLVPAVINNENTLSVTGRGAQGTRTPPKFRSDSLYFL